MRSTLLIPAVLGAMVLSGSLGQAHKGIASKYTYTEDVFPVFLNRCSRCHITGGVAPMSLLTYEEAYPWAEALRAELLARALPASSADDSFVRTAHTSLSARELDVILVWATGGVPVGDPAKTLPTVELRPEWPHGPPDAALPFPAEYRLEPDTMEETRDFIIPTDFGGPRWVRAVDVLPGTPAVVRDVVVYLKPRQVPSARSSEQVLATWFPQQDPRLAAMKTPVRLPAGAQLGLRVHYKKTWKYEGIAMTDRTAVGLYFADRQP